jgi:hypothetical protein
MNEKVAVAQQQRAAANNNNSEAWCRWVDQRIQEHIDHHHAVWRDAIGQVIAQERTARRKEAERAIDTQLAALEKRLKAVPGKLPIAKTWRPETVVYQAEFVCHDGALWQARKDTAQAPGGADWVCVARAGHDGRDGLTPNICGTYDAHKTYEQLDIVALDGAAFIAKRYDPGICPGDGWQLLSRQGRIGRPGHKGEPGPRGIKGEPGPSIVSWQIDRERYRASPLMSDGTVGPNLELRGMFEQFLIETAER